MIKLGAILKWSMSVPLHSQILLPRRRCICNSHWLPARLIFLISIFAYSLFTAAQFLRRWFSVLTQTVTQTPKNQVELSVLETTKLWNFLSRKVRKCLEISAKNIRPTFGTKRPRVRIPTLRPSKKALKLNGFQGFFLFMGCSQTGSKKRKAHKKAHKPFKSPWFLPIRQKKGCSLMAAIRENRKNGKIISYRFTLCLERDAQGKQIRR